MFMSDVYLFESNSCYKGKFLKALSCWRGLGEEKSNQSFLQSALGGIKR